MMTGSYRAELEKRGMRKMNSCLLPWVSTFGYPAGIGTHAPSKKTSSESSSVTLLPAAALVARVNLFSPPGSAASLDPLISIPNCR